MRAVFSIAALLLVLAIIAMVAKRQLSAVAPVPATTAPAGEAAAQPGARRVQQRAQQDLQRALEQGARRASDAG